MQVCVVKLGLMIGRRCLGMKLLPLNFPVFYNCIVKGNTNLKQYDAVSILLLGKPREQCDDPTEIMILDPVAANYVSGKKRIRKEILNPLLLCSVKEAKRRLQMLGFQSIEELVPVLKRLLTVSISLSKEDMDTLLGEYESTGDAYQFVANIFLLSIKCPAKYTFALTKDDKELIQSCYAKKPVHQDLIERSGGQLASVHRDDIWNTAPALSIRYRQVTFQNDYQMVLDYLLPLISEKTALIRLDRAHLDSFFSEAKEDTYIGFFECFGPQSYILEQIQHSQLFSNISSHFFLQIIPPDIGLEQVDLVYEAVAGEKNQLMSSYTGMIIDESMTSDYQKAIILFQRQMTKAEYQERKMHPDKTTNKKRASQHKESDSSSHQARRGGNKMDLFDFIRLYG